VDVRAGSPSFGRWFGCTLSEQNRRQLLIPEGFAHGFLVRSGQALVAYKCSAAYDPAAERTVRWDDPTIGIEWPEPPLLLSPRDAAAPPLAALIR
jgi:dTDP-4-dehydrorhamnose 3,5-epimerase